MEADLLPHNIAELEKAAFCTSTLEVMLKQLQRLGSFEVVTL